MRVRVWHRRGLVEQLRRSRWANGFAVLGVGAPLMLSIAPAALPQIPVTFGPPSSYAGTPVPVVQPAAAHAVRPADTGAKFAPKAIAWPAALSATATLAAPVSGVGVHQA